LTFAADALDTMVVVSNAISRSGAPGAPEPSTRLRGTRRQRTLATRLPRTRPDYLTPEEWRVVTLWADQNLTLDAVAARLGSTRPGVQRLLRKVEDKLRAAERGAAFAGLPARLWRRLAHAGLSSPAIVAGVPDATLAAMTRLGPSGVAAVRAVIPYDPGIRRAPGHPRPRGAVTGAATGNGRTMPR
jgi:hypothetical protein